MRLPPSFALAAAFVVSSVLVAIAFVLRVGIDIPADPPLPDRLIAVLFATAALCSAGLTMRRLPALAWLAAASAAGIVAVEIIAVTRAATPLFPGSRSGLLVLGVLALVMSVVVSASYAARRRGRDRRTAIDRLAVIEGSVAVIATVAAAAWVLSVGPTAAVTSSVDPGLAPIRVAARISLGLAALGIVVGIGRDLAGPVRRAMERRRSARATDPVGPRPSFLSLLGDELLPGRSGERRRAAESERARLAADLHALVLPELRRAAAAAGALPDEVGESVRRSLESIEQLMHERQSIVLEEYGLVAALEWLAERTEDRGSLRVELELDGDRVDDRVAVAPDVARVLFRVALLALDNVVRHAGASVARLHLTVDAGAVRLSIADDGKGAATAEAFAARAGRGLVDMRTDAAAVGAALTVPTVERGTRVEVAWPGPGLAGSPARSAADAAPTSIRHGSHRGKSI